MTLCNPLCTFVQSAHPYAESHLNGGAKRDRTADLDTARVAAESTKNLGNQHLKLKFEQRLKLGCNVLADFCSKVGSAA